MLHGTELNPVPCDKLEGQDGVGDGSGGWEGGDIRKHMADLIHVQRKPTHCKATIPPNKKLT